MGSNTLLRPGLPLDGWLGWPDPINRLVVLCPNFDSKAAAQGQSGMELNFMFFYHLSILNSEPWCTLAGMPIVCIPLLDSVAGGDKT